MFIGYMQEDEHFTDTMQPIKQDFENRESQYIVTDS
jgi:hypothetical protein